MGGLQKPSVQLFARALFMPQAVTIPASGNSAKTRLSPPGLVPYDAKPHLVWRYTPIRAASQGTDVTSCPLLSLLFLRLASTASTTPFVGHSLLVVDIFLAPESSNWRNIGELGKSAQPWYPTSVPLILSHHLSLGRLFSIYLHISPTAYIEFSLAYSFST